MKELLTERSYADEFEDFKALRDDTARLHNLFMQIKQMQATWVIFQEKVFEKMKWIMLQNILGIIVIVLAVLSYWFKK